ncbi:unnamed protein product, partial [Prorocentrum cordatum]
EGRESGLRRGPPRPGAPPRGGAPAPGPSGPAGCPPHGRRDGGRRAAERILGPHGAGARGHPAGPHVLGRGQVRHLRRLSGARRQVQAAAALLCQERSALAPPGSWARRQRQRLDEALKPDFGDVHGEGRLRTERAQRRPQPLPGRRAERPGDGGPLEGRCEARLRPLPAELPAEQAEGVRRARRRRPPEGGPEAAAAAPAQGPSAAAGGAKSAAAMGLVRLELGEVLVSLRQAPDVRRAEPALVVPEPSAGAGEQPQGSRHGRGRGARRVFYKLTFPVHAPLSLYLIAKGFIWRNASAAGAGCDAGAHGLWEALADEDALDWVASLRPARE